MKTTTNEDSLINDADIGQRPDSGWRRALYIVIFEADTRAGRWFDIILLWVILFSTLIVILESDSTIRTAMGGWSFYIEWFITIIFSIEYAVRIAVCKKPLRYVFSFYGMIDLLSILPAYLSLLLPTYRFFMVVRVLRLLRVFRILKLVRFVGAARVLGQALKQSQHKILVFFGAILSLVLIMGTCMHIVEGTQEGFSSIPKSMYWTIVTITTVGYGDVVPVTTLGKFVASVMMLLGYSIIAIPTGIVTGELVEASRTDSSQNSCERCEEGILSDSNYCHKCGEPVQKS